MNEGRVSPEERKSNDKEKDRLETDHIINAENRQDKIGIIGTEG